MLFPPEHVITCLLSDWKLIGKPVKRLDRADKPTGKPVFGADFTLPGASTEL